MAEELLIATVTLDGGGRIGICRLPGLFGSLASDVEAIVAWQPKIVVSMTERSEMRPCGADKLPALLADAAIAWRHLPIHDVGAPPASSRDAWPGIAADLHEVLDDGAAVLLHCRGGQGRSGMIALRLLVERGEAANVALGRVRSVRPGAVETEAQLAWASDGSSARRGAAGSGSP